MKTRFSPVWLHELITIGMDENPNDLQLTPRQFLKAISRLLFIAYSATSLVAIIVLAWLSRTKYGDRFVLIDLVLCALAGPSVRLHITLAFGSFFRGICLDLHEELISMLVRRTGSFTVLSTKAISSFLNLMFLDTFVAFLSLSRHRTVD